MNSVSHKELTDHLLARVHEIAGARGLVTGEVSPETDLLTAGILDSMGFVDLLMFLETEYGYRIDLTEADPARFSTVQGLCELALSPVERLRAEAC